MAIDTLQKLVSALKKSLPFPDGTVIDDGDLQHVTWNYAGFSAGPAIPPSLKQFAVVDSFRMGVGLSQGVRSGSATAGALRMHIGTHDTLG